MRSSILTYFKKAFLYHWNLLIFGAGIAVGFISGYPDIVVPVIGAGEIVYLAGLATNRRFQAFVDATELSETPHDQLGASQDKVKTIFLSIKKEDREHYEELKDMCSKLQNISLKMKGDQEDFTGLSDMQLTGINRLLWIYLKLLYTKNLIEYSLDTIDVKAIHQDIRRTQKRLTDIGPEAEDDASESKRRKSLEDMLTTSEQRLRNYHQAKENYDFIKLEQERLYSKIAGLAEMGIQRQDADFLSGEIDVVSDSVVHTEATMRDLEFITGFTSQDEEPPPLLMASARVGMEHG